MQFLLYIVVGGSSFIVDIGAFIVLRTLDVTIMVASVMSVIIASAANYALSVMLAFERAHFQRHTELLRFAFVVLVGLGLNTILVWFFVFQLSMQATLAKIVAVPIVLIWNFLGRRQIVFSNQTPVAMRALVDKGKRLIGSSSCSGRRRKPGN